MEANENNIKLSIVIPVYKSASIIPKLIEEIYSEINKVSLNNQCELLLVNDSSPDNSWSMICEQAKNYSFVKGISLRRNFGQHNAIMAG